ncbi:MAG: cytochrome c oxidase assembly protein [Alphaproteobacteria bacterium]|nr:cytochrome c oxidase assembly protein [Alphaproteobacteria bacterium]
MKKNDKNLAIILAAASFVMLGMAYASVPLYMLFCQKTGFGGTTQMAKAPSQQIIEDREVTVQFVANTHRDLPWLFKPLQSQTKIKVGENTMAFYLAENQSERPIIGMATYNVAPDKAAIYFSKVQCFCFDEQKLEPHQSMEMPVLFFLDPEFAKDPDLKDVKVITLSYTFFEFKK